MKVYTLSTTNCIPIQEILVGDQNKIQILDYIQNGKVVKSNNKTKFKTN